MKQTNMTAPIEETRVTFERLISTCEETRERFRQAAAAAENTSVRRLLNLYAQQRTRFAEELLQEIHGAEPHASADGASLLHESGPKPAASTDGSDMELLRQCLQTETRALESYRDALGSRIPTRAHFLVSAQHSLMQKAHERMQGLLADAMHTGSGMHFTSVARTAL